MASTGSKLIPICIAGGGLVGALCALLLAEQGLPTVVLEPREQGPSPDKRTIALAAATLAQLQQLGLLEKLAQRSAIEHIHISDRGHLGAVELHAEQAQVPALGEVVSAAALSEVLYQACQQQPLIEWRGGAGVDKLEQQQHQVSVTLTNGEQLQTALIIGADGNRSQVRESLAIATEVTDYQQVGWIATLELADDLQGWAYERFTDTGPMALLPMPQRQASLVWSVTPEQAEAMKHWSDAQFLAGAQQAFGYRAGRFIKVSQRLAFPLQLRLAERSVCHRAVLIGNASHALHPIAGQGFNLGVRDAQVLAKVCAGQTDPGAFNVLSAYQQQRQQDYKAIIGFTDTLVRTFSNQHLPLVVGRNLALFGLAHCSLLRSRVADQSMGIAV